MVNISYLYFSEYDPGEVHGIQIIETCNALADLGHEVTLYSRGDIEPFIEKHGLSVEFPIESCPGKAFTMTVNRGIYYTYSLAKARNSDIIYTRDIRFLKYLSLLPAVNHPPIVYEAHKVYSQLEGMSEEQERSYIANAETVIAISKGVERDLERIGIDVNDVVSVGVDYSKIPS